MSLRGTKQSPVTRGLLREEHPRNDIHKGRRKEFIWRTIQGLPDFENLGGLAKKEITNASCRPKVRREAFFQLYPAFIITAQAT